MDLKRRIKTLWETIRLQEILGYRWYLNGKINWRNETEVKGAP